MITIIDYGLGNLGSVYNILKKIGATAEITNDLDKIRNAKKILLPGVGAFDSAMKLLTNSELRNILDTKALVEKIPILGICLGMQLLGKGSEEGEMKGLNWIPSYSYKFNFPEESNLKVPHMGWNLVKRSTESQLTKGFDDEFRFYFVHSYYVKVEDEKHSILKTQHGLEFDSAIQMDNIFGAQFHAEKSHKYGMKLFDNFSKL